MSLVIFRCAKYKFAFFSNIFSLRHVLVLCRELLESGDYDILDRQCAIIIRNPLDAWVCEGFVAVSTIRYVVLCGYVVYCVLCEVHGVIG